MIPNRALRLSCCAAAALILVACGGGNATIGGTLSGLGDGLSVTLQNNGTDNLTLTENGAFTFDDTVDADSDYSVTVLTQPVGQSCNVANGSGTIDSEDTEVDNITVTCTATSSLGGTITGLRSGASVTLLNDGTELTVAANGEFAFPGVLEAGTTYSVTIKTQPAAGNCTVTDGSGTIVEGEMSEVTVTCT